MRHSSTAGRQTAGARGLKNGKNSGLLLQTLERECHPVALDTARGLASSPQNRCIGWEQPSLPPPPAGRPVVSAPRALPVVDDISGEPRLVLPRQASSARPFNLVPFFPRRACLGCRRWCQCAGASFVLGRRHVAGPKPPLLDHVRAAAVHEVYFLGHCLEAIARQLRFGGCERRTRQEKVPPGHPFALNTTKSRLRSANSTRKVEGSWSLRYGRTAGTSIVGPFLLGLCARRHRSAAGRVEAWVVLGECLYTHEADC